MATTPRTCKTCAHWTRAAELDAKYHGKHAGRCNSVSFVYGSNVPKSGLAYWDQESYSAGFMTGEDFGCIHHTSKAD